MRCARADSSVLAAALSAGGLRVVASGVVSIALTTLIMTAARARHAPACATTLIVSLGVLPRFTDRALIMAAVIGMFLLHRLAFCGSDPRAAAIAGSPVDGAAYRRGGCGRHGAENRKTGGPGSRRKARKMLGCCLGGPGEIPGKASMRHPGAYDPSPWENDHAGHWLSAWRVGRCRRRHSRPGSDDPRQRPRSAATRRGGSAVRCALAIGRRRRRDDRLGRSCCRCPAVCGPTPWSATLPRRSGRSSCPIIWRSRPLDARLPHRRQGPQPLAPTGSAAYRAAWPCRPSRFSVPTPA